MQSCIQPTPSPDIERMASAVASSFPVDAPIPAINPEQLAQAISLAIEQRATRRADDDDRLIPAPEARRLAGGISDMSLWRWIHKGLIPRPMVIQKRRYWRRAEFLAALDQAGKVGGAA